MMKVLAEIPAKHFIGDPDKPLVKITDINFKERDEVVIQVPISRAYDGDNFFIVNLGEGFPANLVIPREAVKRFVLVPE